MVVIENLKNRAIFLVFKKNSEYEVPKMWE